MANNAKQTQKKPQGQNKPAEEKKFVNPVLSWSILALELIAAIVIGCIVLRF